MDAGGSGADIYSGVFSCSQSEWKYFCGYIWRNLPVYGQCYDLVVCRLGLRFCQFHTIDSKGSLLASGSFAGDGNGVIRSTNNGDSWVQVGSGLGIGEVHNLFLDAQGNLYAGTLFYGIFRSTNDGDTWRQVDGEESPLRSIAINSNGNLFGTTYDGYHGTVFYSPMSSESWTPVFSLIDTINVLAISSNAYIFAGTGSKGIFRSTDTGASWNQIYKVNPISSVKSIAINKTGYIFAGHASGEIDLSTNSGGEVWNNSYRGNADISVITVDLSNNVFAGTKYGIVRSTDNGSNWNQVNVGLTTTDVYAMAASSNGALLAGTNGGGIFRSMDNGGNWMQVNTGLTNLTVRSLAANSVGYFFAATDSGVSR